MTTRAPIRPLPALILSLLPVAVVAGLIVLAVSLFGGDEKRPVKLDPGVAAKVGEVEIRDEQVKAWLAVINPKAAGGEYAQEDLVGALDVLAVNAWVAEEAERRGVTVSAKELAATRVGAVKGAPKADVDAFRRRAALLEKIAQDAAGPTPVATAEQIATLAETLHEKFELAENRSFFEIANRDKAKVMGAYRALADGSIQPAEAVERYSDDPAARVVSGFQVATSDSLDIEVAALVFTARRFKPTRPELIDGRWRTYVVTQIAAAQHAPSAKRLRESAERMLTTDAHEQRVDAEYGS
jgi:hypothetical protein